jgi:hypothetical protein
MIETPVLAAADEVYAKLRQLDSPADAATALVLAHVRLYSETGDADVDAVIENWAQCFREILRLHRLVA